MKLLIRAQAELQIKRIAAWYEQQSKGLGMEFLRAVDAVLAVIRRQRGSFVKVHGVVRRISLRRFPHALFYIQDEKAIQVLRCLHQHRDPRTWPQ